MPVRGSSEDLPDEFAALVQRVRVLERQLFSRPRGFPNVEDSSCITVEGTGALEDPFRFLLACGFLINVTEIAQGTTTYTPPGAATALLIECIGSGGGGGGSDTAAVSAGAGGGGGGGGYAMVFIENPEPSYSCVVGAGGAGGAAGNNNGVTGADTTFDSPSQATAGGGTFGGGSAAGVGAGEAGSGGVGGAGSVGLLLMKGNDGDQGLRFSGTQAHGGAGGAAARGGGGGRGPNAVGAGLAGGDYGGGGGGGKVENGSAAAAGGDGADGRILVWEFATS